jgi:hypothetical protein
LFEDYGPVWKAGIQKFFYVWTPAPSSRGQALRGDEAWMPAWRRHDGKLFERSMKLADHFVFSLQALREEKYRKALCRQMQECRQ